MKQVIIVLVALLLVTFTFPLTVSAQEDVDHVPAYQPVDKIDTSPVVLPKITRKVYRNGLTIYYVPHHELPVVSMRLLALKGSLYNPADKAGLTEFMSDLMTQGTKSRSATEIAESIDFIGGSLNSGAGWNGTYVQCSVLKKDLETGLDLLSDVVLHPSFPEEEIDRLRTRTVSSIMSDKDSPGTIASKQFAKFLYGGHPYASPLSGTMESVQSFTRDDIISQYHRIFNPGNVVLAIAGDINPKKVNKLVSKYFGTWQKSGDSPKEPAAPERGAGGEILLVDKPDAVQSEVRLGYILEPSNFNGNSSEMFAFKVMNYIFGGGGFSSRLMLRIRNDLGLTYGIYSNLASRQQNGAYTISSFTKTESTGEMVKEVFGVMNKTLEEGFTEDELNDAKSFLAGQYPSNFETPSSIASQFQSVLLFDLGKPDKYISSYRQKIAEVTLEDVNRMAKKYLHPDWLRIVVVGKAEEVRDQLAPFGKLKVISIDEL